MGRYLLIENVQVENANAYNHIVVGMPAVTGFLGAVHALERKLNDISLGGVGIIVHEYQLHHVKDDDRNVHLTIPTPSQIKSHGFKLNEHVVNQAYMDLTISLLVEIIDVAEETNIKKICSSVKRKLNTMRIAGGIVVSADNVKVIDDDYKLYRGYALMMCDDNINIYGDALDYAIEKIITKPECMLMQTGFKAITGICKVENSRDMDRKHVFAEGIYRLCKFVNVKEVGGFYRLLWRYKYDSRQGLYECTQQ